MGNTICKVSGCIFFYYFGRTPSRTRHETLVKYYNKKEGKQKKAFFNSSSKSAHDLRVRYLANSTSLNKNARKQEYTSKGKVLSPVLHTVGL